MTYHTDLTFFTNEPERNLYERFNKILRSNTQFFDVLVGYFRTSGFYMLYPSMEDIEKVRILVGLNVDQKTVEIIQKSESEQISFDRTFKEIKDDFKNEVIKDLENSEDSMNVEEGIYKFIEWLQSGKLELRIYPKEPLHAKVYIMRKDQEKVPDYFGSVITGSSNFSKAGLVDNLEFNVELKDSRDVKFALEKFEELWSESIPISEEYIDTVKTKTWLNDEVTPYEMFLKTLYEYFKEEINEDKSTYFSNLLPDGFMELEYQLDAVTQAKRILDTYNGVFISDVVGLGKTFISAMLAQRLTGRKLVICPPVLKDYWERTLQQFNVAAKVESLGKLDSILNDKDLMDNIEYVFIDEAHRFRNSDTESYSKLHQICFNKKVILISATPLNNYSTDIENQIYLFQARKNSTIIPNNKNLELFFSELNNDLKKLEKGTEEYQEKLKENSEIIRDEVLRNIMVRRTRNEIIKYYDVDMQKQGLKFPTLNDPERIIYTFNPVVEEAFNTTIKQIQKLTYARYRPLTYLREEHLTGEISSILVSQRNMSGFMKGILIKRLESSFYAFRKTLNRFIESHEQFLNMSDSGDIFISKNIDVYDLLGNDDDEKLLQLVEEDRVQHYKTKEFKSDFILSIKHDLAILKSLKEKWNDIKEDPKKDQFLKELKDNNNLSDNKLIIFTESKETADYIGDYLEADYPEQVIVYSGQGSKNTRDRIEANYNPNYNFEKENDIKILVTTDVLSEGINLHRSNVVINYDLPWNPTKIMQRVGRVNRVGTEHDELHVFNFFPTDQSSKHLTLEDNIISKIQAFHDTLGEDFKYLSDDEEVSSHNLYAQLNTKETYDDSTSSESELEYLQIIRNVRDSDEDLFIKIIEMPKKSRISMYGNVENNSVISFVRHGDLKKFYLTDDLKTEEMYFLEAIKYLADYENKKSLRIDENYYKLLEQNKNKFKTDLKDQTQILANTKQYSKNENTIIKNLQGIRSSRMVPGEEIDKINNIIDSFREGNIPPNISKKIVKDIKIVSKENDILKLYYSIIDSIPNIYTQNRSILDKSNKDNIMEVILSNYLIKEQRNE